ncbi:MAG: hypothetical protein IT361_04820 [Gemmatimonadaceae bacterium]|nr:hypothetical protein [Gemmatimonadaceae bacterium]
MADSAELTEVARRLVQANARLYKGWLDLSMEYVRGVSEILAGAPPGGTSAGSPVTEVEGSAGALVIEGEAGKVVKGSFLVTNDLGRAVTCSFAGSDFRDARGAAVAARTTFSPAAVTLAPGEEQVVEVEVAVDDAFAAGVGYAGEVTIKGLDGMAVPIVVRRLHPVDDARDATPDAAGTTKESGASRASGQPRGRKRARTRNPK